MLDQLQGRFGGSDVVAIATALLGVAVSIVVAVRQHKLEARNVEMQGRLTAIEEARFTQETARAKEADVRVMLRGKLKSKGRGKDYHLFFENRGEAVALNVEMTSIDSVPPGPPVPTTCDDVFPLAALQPGDSVNCAVNLFGGHGPSFDVSVSWTDGRGRETRVRRVTATS